MEAELPLALYRAATAALAPFSSALLAWRRHRGKEDAGRLLERKGLASLPRRSGALVWLHGASVGESLSLLPLVQRLAARGFLVLITTGTVSSAQVLKARLPAGAVHQFVPLDVPRFISRFLDHWRPDLVLIAESELWPNLLCQVSARSIPIALVNARLSQRSFARWSRLPRAVASLLRRIDLCLAQTRDDAARLLRLGAPRVQVAGNLKYDALAPPVGAAELAALSGCIGSRPVWLAASTHPGEEAIALDVHRRLAPRFPDLLTIIAPRHAARGGEIEALAAGCGLVSARRSNGAAIDGRTAVYIADTMGESGLYYRLAGVAFVGKSLAAQGGQNPIEPAKLGSAILHGPHVENFEEVYRELDASCGAAEVRDVGALAEAVGALLSDVSSMRKMARAASETVERVGGACDRILQALEPYFLQMQVQRR